MNFTTLKAAVAASSFDDVADADLGVCVNDALTWVDEMYRWPYRETTITGAVPLTIADLGEVGTVLDAVANIPLAPASRAELLNRFGDLTVVGAPAYWYRETLGGTMKLSTYPVAPGNITVRYYRAPAVLSGGSDEPGVAGLCGAPLRYHSVYVAIARRDAFLKFRGDGASAQTEQQFANAWLARMCDALNVDVGQTEIPLVGDDC